MPLSGISSSSSLTTSKSYSSRIIILVTTVLLVCGILVTHEYASNLLPVTHTSEASRHNNHDEVEDKPQIKTTERILSDEALDFTPLEISAENKYWTPKVCMPGTLLNSPKLLQNCKKSRIVPAEVFCPKQQEHSSDDNNSKLPLCGQYSGGKFIKQLKSSSSLKKKSIAAIDSSSSKCDFKSHLEDKISSANWYFEKKQNLLKSRSCNFEYFLPQKIYSILTQAVNSRASSSSSSSGRNLRPFILFSGDSMMRQLFIRLISLLRGQLEEPLSEHYFHFDVAYVVVDGKYDAFVPLLSGKVAASAVAPNIRSQVAKLLIRNGIIEKNSDIAKVLGETSSSSNKGLSDEDQQEGENDTSNDLVMLFQWETKPSKSRNEFLKLRPAVQVAAWMYWWQKKDPLSDFDAYSQVMDKYQAAQLQNNNDNKKTALLVFVTTPWTREGVFGGVDEQIRVPRNRKAIEWLRQDSSSKNSRRLLDFSAIADLKKFSKARDEIHYMCIWQPKLPATVNEQKFVPDTKCLDKMNAAVAQVLLHTLM